MIKKKCKAIVLDIEGTVGPIQFVHNVLFPYATERLLDYLRSNPLSDEVLNAILDENSRDFAQGNFARIENPSDPQEVNAYLQHLIRLDRKFGPLKFIQGKIWKEGFELGDLKSEFFSDLPEFLAICQRSDLKVFIYSSGSREAQILYFSHSQYGNLSEYIAGYFDTTIGNKRSSQSYLNISQETGIPVGDICFFTDIVEEADAAQSAGFYKSYILNRPGNHPQPIHKHPCLLDLLGFFESRD